jgi:cytochrome P450/NADPH-cytochrome P450 reductase
VHGANRIHDRGAGDAHADFGSQYRVWHADLWLAVAATLGIETVELQPAAFGARLSITMVNRQLTNPVVLSYEATPARVAENRELSAIGPVSPCVGSTRHIEVALPDDLEYRAGDHLGVRPRNSIGLIRRVMFRFGLDAGMYLTIIANAETPTHLPLDETAPLLGVLGSCVELQARATRADIEVLARHTEDPVQRAERSSQLISPRTCSITVGVLRGPAAGGDRDAGVCLNYLSSMSSNSTIFVFKREPTIPFRPPADPSVPMIMVGAGTGLAPFRGFLQEQAAQGERGDELAPSLLVFGCRTPEHDDPYRAEMESFRKSANVRIYTAYSRAPVDGRKYAQRQMLAHQDEIGERIDSGASVFVCGNARTLAPGVRAALTQIHPSRTGSTAAEAELAGAALPVAGGTSWAAFSRTMAESQASPTDASCIVRCR